MTHQPNKTRPSRLAPRGDILDCRITHVRYVGLAVVDLDRGIGFYRDDWGLSHEGHESGVAYLAALGSIDPYCLRLREAEANRLDLVSFAVGTGTDVDWYADRLAEAGISIVVEPGPLQGPGGGYGFRFLDPVEGRTLEIASDFSPREAQEIEDREHVTVGISHMVFNSPRADDLVEFFHR